MIDLSWKRIRRSLAFRSRAAREKVARLLGRRPLSQRPSSYDERIARELAIFEGQVAVHELPGIFHYWSNRYLRPMMESLGYSHPEDFYAREIAAARARAGRPIRVLSLGAGNGESEIAVAGLLRERGVDGVRIYCMDINPAMLHRCRQAAADSGLAEVVEPEQGDFNRWWPDDQWDVVMANQSLHHVVELEHLCAAIHHAIGEDGVFLSCDMIGRNGHRRWPEVLPALQRFWAELPPAKRYNLQLRRLEERFLDWDCSHEGFEGVRAQDILPLLVDHFAFRAFLGWGNLIDPFVDRSFGHHFDEADPWARDFIDRVHAADEAALAAGSWKPTHMLAVMARKPDGPTRQWRHLSPDWCVRDPRSTWQRWRDRVAGRSRKPVDARR